METWRFKKGGEIVARQRRVPLRDRFDAMIDKRSDGCWLWTGSLESHGYGKVRVGGKKVGVHRLNWELLRGPIPAGLVLRHTCDRRHCVNPDHLIPGTHDENMADMLLRQRQRGAVGDRNSHAKLTSAQIPLIRAAHRRGRTCTSLAKALDVSAVQISKIVRGVAWSEVA